jgi:glyoxylase-like metal-dependent hydrolase (beta-lactamase superfamily II)
LQKANFATALEPNLKEKASYLQENVKILEGAKLNLVDGSFSIDDDLIVHRVDGHTVGQQFVEIKNGEQKMYYPADLIPTSSHIPVAYHMGYDICAATILKEKKDFLDKVFEEKALIVFEHDPLIEAGYLAKDERGNYCLGQAVSF